MREIKFRAWSFVRKEFAYMTVLNVGSLLFEPDGANNWGELYSQELNSVSQLMQYTGLKDKNGVEIFEGDILDCPSPFAGIKGGATKVVYIGGCFEPFGNDELSADPERCEVIGNIYEHPHLLEAA